MKVCSYSVDLLATAESLRIQHLLPSAAEDLASTGIDRISVFST